MHFAAHLLLFPSHYLIRFSRHLGNRTVNSFETKWYVSFKSTLKMKDRSVHYWVNNVCHNWVKRNVNYVIHPRWIFCYIARGPLEPWGPWTLSTLSIGCDATGYRIVAVTRTPSGTVSDILPHLQGTWTWHGDWLWPSEVLHFPKGTGKPIVEITTYKSRALSDSCVNSVEV